MHVRILLKAGRDGAGKDDKKRRGLEAEGKGLGAERRGLEAEKKGHIKNRRKGGAFSPVCFRVRITR